MSNNKLIKILTPIYYISPSIGGGFIGNAISRNNIVVGIIGGSIFITSFIILYIVDKLKQTQ